MWKPVAHEIARAVDGYKLIVEKEHGSGLHLRMIRRAMALNGVPAGSFDVISNPEFCAKAPRLPIPDWTSIVVGADNAKAATIASGHLFALTGGEYHGRPDAIARPASVAVAVPQLIVTSAKSAELIKYAVQCLSGHEDRYINAIANVCELVGADIERVCRGLGSDSRIGSRFLQPASATAVLAFPRT